MMFSMIDDALDSERYNTAAIPASGRGGPAPRAQDASAMANVVASAVAISRSAIGTARYGSYLYERPSRSVQVYVAIGEPLSKRMYLYLVKIAVFVKTVVQARRPVPISNLGRTNSDGRATPKPDGYGSPAWSQHAGHHHSLRIDTGTDLRL